MRIEPWVLRVDASADNKAIARHLAAAFGQPRPKVVRWKHDTEEIFVDLLSCQDSPWQGITSYSTITLSDHPLWDDAGREFPARIEIAGACASSANEFGSVLTSAAFRIIRTKRLARPGLGFENYVSEYFPTTTVPHLYFTAPFLWEDALNTTLELETKQVTWLLAMPISSAESAFLEAHGSEQLEKLFESKQVDITDLQRASAV